MRSSKLLAGGAGGLVAVGAATVVAVFGSGTAQTKPHHNNGHHTGQTKPHHNNG